ncbi:MAG TPA: transketolase C-terminal domain-containing protein [Vicinamibacterales bacterium]|nr:transketolase C-terminal domain-containing protein [Vicinamibacterales bacterium]
MNQLHYVPREAFAGVIAADPSASARCDAFAAMCRINALYMIARAGSGHIGTSFSAMDLLAYLYLNALTADDVFFSSKGHDAPAQYAVLTALGRIPFDKIHALRRLDGLPGHPDVATPGVAANTGSLGMGISKAKGMLLANRINGTPGRVFVLTGDGELQEGQFWESLPSAANAALGGLTVIVDHNKIQSDTFVERVSDLGDLEGKLRAFGWHVARVDGHDAAAIARAFDALERVTVQPKIVIADTVKGRGVSFMEGTAFAAADRCYKFHSGAPDAETYARALPELVDQANRALQQLKRPPLALTRTERPARQLPAHPQKLVAAYSRALVEQARTNPRIVAFDADLALDTGLLPFEAEFPDRFVECGIAEQDMVSQAGGAALRGLLPVVHSFACFLSDRPNEQIFNNATERTKVVYVGSLAGVIPGGPGHSHQCVRDIAALSAIPGLTLVEPSCEREVAMATAFAMRASTGACYVRLVSVPWEITFDLPADYELQVGRGVTLVDGDDAVLFGYGPVTLSEAATAARLLRERRGVSLRVVNLPWLNRIDPVWLRDVVGSRSAVFTLDNHLIDGGQGDMILRTLAELGLVPPVAQRIGVSGIPVCGQNDEVLRAHGLDADSLCATIAAALGVKVPA